MLLVRLTPLKLHTHPTTLHTCTYAYMKIYADTLPSMFIPDTPEKGA